MTAGFGSGEASRSLVIGIDIEQAATRFDLSTLVLTGFPGETHRMSA